MLKKNDFDFKSINFSYIDSYKEYSKFSDKINRDNCFVSCSLDLEADSLYSYESKLCLIQIRVGNDLIIIDPLLIGIDKLSSFPVIIDSFSNVWMHGSNFDVKILNKTFKGWSPENLKDTQIAARFLGIKKFGLSDLLNKEYGVNIQKKFQKSNWKKRPLPKCFKNYAFNDVKYLLDLGEKFLYRLKKLNREEWFSETCKTLNKVEKNSNEYDKWRIPGSGKMSRKGLNYLFYLWKWRDSNAKEIDCPASILINNKSLIELVDNLEKGINIKTIQFKKNKRYYSKESENSLILAIKKASKIDKEFYPHKNLVKKNNKIYLDRELIDEITLYRNKLSKDLNIEQSFIASRRTIEQISIDYLDKINNNKQNYLLNWQKKLFSKYIKN